MIWKDDSLRSIVGFPFRQAGHDVYSCVYCLMDSRDLIRKLEADGWFKVGQRGSHVQFKHPARPGRVTVPHPKRDLAIGTVKSIERQSGLKLR